MSSGPPSLRRTPVPPRIESARAHVVKHVASQCSMRTPNDTTAAARNRRERTSAGSVTSDSRCVSVSGGEIRAAIFVSPAELPARNRGLDDGPSLQQNAPRAARMKCQQDELAIERIERAVEPGRQLAQARAELAHLSAQDGASHQGDFIARLEQRNQRMKLLPDHRSPMCAVQQFEESIGRNMKFEHGVRGIELDPIIENPRLTGRP